MSIKEVSRNKCFGGHVVKYEHHSEQLGCDMKFNVFLPVESTKAKVPGIFFLSGLTCTEDNFIQKSGAMAEASKHGIALIAPDTSPRKFLKTRDRRYIKMFKRIKINFRYIGGIKIEGDDDSWDFGTGAGFYLDATEEKWSKHYRMYSYIVKELHSLIMQQLPIVSLSLLLLTLTALLCTYTDSVLLGRKSCFCYGTLYGWTWCINNLYQKSHKIQNCVCIFSYCQSNQLSLGSKGLFKLSRIQQGVMETI